MSTSAPTSNISQDITNTPIFNEFIDKKVRVYRDDSHFEGICRSLDGYLNCVLENAIFVEREQLDEKQSAGLVENPEQNSIKLKTTFVSGSSVKHISISNK